MRKIERIVFKGYILNVKHKSNNRLLNLCIKQEKLFYNKNGKKEKRNSRHILWKQVFLTNTFILF